LYWQTHQEQVQKPAVAGTQRFLSAVVLGPLPRCFVLHALQSKLQREAQNFLVFVGVVFVVLFARFFLCSPAAATATHAAGCCPGDQPGSATRPAAASRSAVESQKPELVRAQVALAVNCRLGSKRRLPTALKLGGRAPTLEGTEKGGLEVTFSGKSHTIIPGIRPLGILSPTYTQSLPLLGSELLRSAIRLLQDPMDNYRTAANETRSRRTG
jgi:hypothetical protein